MKFLDLLTLSYNKNSDVIDIDAIHRALPDTPMEVAQQFYADHGRKDEFQSAYRSINLDQLTWVLTVEPAEVLVAASMNPRFRRWFDNVGARVASFSFEGWCCIDIRKKVQDHWAQNQTWLVPPVMIAGEVVGATSHLHIVEGHTRLGLLAGLIKCGVLPGTSLHRIWLGNIDAT